MSAPAVLYETVGRIAKITINRPEAVNAIKLAMGTGLAVRESKAVAYRALDAAMYLSDEAWTISDAATSRNRSSEDAAEGARAFLEKRLPHWKGR